MRRTFDVLAVGEVLWLATDQGLVRYANGVAEQMNMEGGPGTTSVRSLATGNGPWLWAGTLNGLYRIDPNEPGKNLRRYGRSHGLPSNSIYDIVCDHDRIWLVAGPDLCVFEPDRMEPPTQRVQLRILGISGLNEELLSAEGVRFDPEVSHVRVHLRNFDQLRTTDAPFRYRLAGQPAWTAARQPTIELIGIKHGEYRLEVQAADGNGVWGPSVYASWSITPAIWQRRWFAGLVFLLIGSVATAFVMYYRNRKQREALLNAEVHRYHHKALLAQMEPHFLYNALNSIQGFISRSDVEASTRYLAKFAKLMRGNLQAAHNEHITLEEEATLLDHYCALEALRSEPPFTYTITVAQGLDRATIVLPAFLVQPYAENAVRHGLRNLHGERAGVLVIRFEREGTDRLRCIVEDNGVGRDRARSLTAEGNAWRSHGMRINEERTKLLSKHLGQGTIKLVSEDLVDVNNDPCGTRVSISLPLVFGTPSEANQQDIQRLPNA